MWLFVRWSAPNAGDVEFYVLDRLHGLSTTVACHQAFAAAELGEPYRRERVPMTTLAGI